MKIQKVSHPKNIKKLLLISICTLCVAIVVLIVLEKTHSTDIIRMNGPLPSLNNSDDEKAETTSKTPSAQSSFNSGAPRNTNTSQAPEGTVSDQKGTIENIPNESMWTKSSNGELVVYTPGQNALLQNGQPLTGISNGERVSFRLIDNLHGTIAQGSIAVVNGKFAGTFNFETVATEGQVEVFNQSYDGTESNNVAIPVRFR